MSKTLLSLAAAAAVILACRTNAPDLVVPEPSAAPGVSPTEQAPKLDWQPGEMPPQPPEPADEDLEQLPPPDDPPDGDEESQAVTIDYQARW